MILLLSSSHVLSTKDEPRQTDQGWHYVKLMLNRFANLHKWPSMCYVVGGWQLSRIQVSHVAGTLRPCHAAGSAWWSASLISLRAKDPVATTGSGHPYFLAWPLLAWGAGGQFLPSISVMQFRIFYANSSLQQSSFQEQFDEIPISVFMQTLEWAQDQLNTWMAQILGTRYMDSISLASWATSLHVWYSSRLWSTASVLFPCQCHLGAAEAGNVQKEDAEVFMRKFCDLRAILAGLNESCTGKWQMWIHRLWNIWFRFIEITLELYTMNRRS